MGLHLLQAGTALSKCICYGSVLPQITPSQSTQRGASKQEKPLFFGTWHPISPGRTRQSVFVSRWKFHIFFCHSLLFFHSQYSAVTKFQKLEQVGSSRRAMALWVGDVADKIQALLSSKTMMYSFFAWFYFFIAQVFANTNPNVTEGVQGRGINAIA